MSDIPNEAIKAVALILGEGGADALHGWRCDHPDRYGPCTCLAELAEDTLKDLRDAIHRDGDDADAIRQALGLRWAHNRSFPKRRVVGEWQETP